MVVISIGFVLGGLVAGTNMLARSVQELGLAAWFGGSLIGSLEDTNGAGPRHWRSGSAPVTLTAIGAYLSKPFFVMTGNEGRLAGQQGIATISAVKICYRRRLGGHGLHSAF